MAHIKKISFASVGDKEGCTCDRCGQYIKNIWTVQFVEGITMNYGIDCFEKLYKTGNLNDYGKKLMKKALKRLESIYKAMERQAELTEETDDSWKAMQAEWNKNNAWYGEKYADYKKWMLEELYPYRISKAHEDIEKFKKIDFKEV